MPTPLRFLGYVVVLFLCSVAIEFVTTYFVSFPARCCWKETNRRRGRNGSRNIGNTNEGGGAWVVVTGGTSGLGLALARELAQSGYARICVVSRSEDKLEATKREVEALGEDVIIKIIPFDMTKVTKREDRWKSLREAFDELGSICMLVNNVGIAQQRPDDFGCVEWSELRRLIDVNVVATTRITHMLLPDLEEQRYVNGDRGLVVFVGSISGRFELPIPTLACYSASKAYVHTLATAIEEEYRGSVDVLRISPSVFDTSLSRRLFAFDGGGGGVLKCIVQPLSAKSVAKAIVTQLKRGVRGDSAGHWSHGILLGLKRAMCVCKWPYLAIVSTALRSNSRRRRRREKAGETTHGEMEGSLEAKGHLDGPFGEAPEERDSLLGSRDGSRAP